MPKVSIVIPTYNAELYIEETLKSVFNQTFTDYEIIVVDDGSIDSTSNIVEQHSNKILLLKKVNGGPASARNLGIKNAKGIYIAFLDNDDIWLPNKLEIQIAYMDRHPAVGFSYTQAHCFSLDNAGNKVSRRDLICNLEGNLFKDLFWSNFIVNSTVMIRKSCFEEIGLLDESKNFIGAEDYDLWLRLSRTYKLGCVSDILLEYRLRENSLIGESYERAFPKHIYIYDKFYRTYDDIAGLYGMSKSEALSDLCVRYGFKNFVNQEYALSLKKILFSARYNIIKAVIMFGIVILRIKATWVWNRFIPKFGLWNRICRTKW